MTEWESGFTSGVTATLVGFLCTILWDLYKHQRDKTSIETNAIKYVHQELSANIEILAKNRSLVEEELQNVRRQKDVINPLASFRAGYWDLIKIERPKKILKAGKLFSNLKVLYEMLEYANECIKYRAMSKFSIYESKFFHSVLEKQDMILEAQFAQIQAKLEEVQDAVSNLTRLST